jgi:hypothetical protein
MKHRSIVVFSGYRKTTGAATAVSCCLGAVLGRPQELDSLIRPYPQSDGSRSAMAESRADPEHSLKGLLPARGSVTVRWSESRSRWSRREIHFWASGCGAAWP